MDYSWIDGVTSRCRCGQPGRWYSTEEGIMVDHLSKLCEIKDMTAREERELRLAVGRKRPY